MHQMLGTTKTKIKTKPIWDFESDLDELDTLARLLKPFLEKFFPSAIQDILLSLKVLE
ncbi:MAG: hypothetical protein HWN67_04030 [Candidatus Helarchaeota archaeon]|nr:hypothetical protein [Candidatus Helarchaeota archaeon]